MLQGPCTEQVGLKGAVCCVLEDSVPSGRGPAGCGAAANKTANREHMTVRMSMGLSMGMRTSKNMAVSVSKCRPQVGKNQCPK